MNSLITNLLIILVVIIIVFLILRELQMWYWKINERVNLLKSIDEKLALLVERKPPSQRKTKSQKDLSELEAEHNREHPKRKWENLKPKN